MVRHWTDSLQSKRSHRLQKKKKRSEAGRDKTEQNGQKERKRKGDQVKISFAVHGMQRKEWSLSVIVPSLGSCKTFCHWVPPNKGVGVHIVIVMCAKIKLKNTHVHVITRKQQNMLQPDSYWNHSSIEHTGHAGALIHIQARSALKSLICKLKAL